MNVVLPILESLIRFLTTQMASWSDRFASSTTMRFEPLMKTVTALVFLHSSMTSIRSLVVPRSISRTTPAEPSLAEVNSWNLG